MNNRMSRRGAQAVRKFMKDHQEVVEVHPDKKLIAEIVIPDVIPGETFFNQGWVFHIGTSKATYPHEVIYSQEMYLKDRAEFLAFEHDQWVQMLVNEALIKREEAARKKMLDA